MSPATRQHIVVDREVCIGSGNCTFYAEATFDLDDNNRSYVVDPEGDDVARQRTAVQNCPTGALSFIDGRDG